MRVLARGLLLSLTAWLLWPALGAVHVEGFSAQIQSLGMLFAERGTIVGHDVARPVISEFIFFTRPGVVDLLALANRLFGYSGDTGMRVLTVASLLALLAGSMVVACRLGRVRWESALLAFVLIPGLVELGFFFNDNVVSAGFAALAMAAAVTFGGLWGAVVSGALLGMAVLCRLDAVLAAPLVLLMRAMAASGGGTPLLIDLLLQLVAAVAVQAFGAWWNEGSIREGLVLLKLFGERHLTGHGRIPGKIPVLYFLGPVALCLAPLGAARLWKKRADGRHGLLLWRAAVYGYPALVLLYVLRTTIELRYFTPLIGPILVLHVAAGCEWLVDAWRRPRHRLLRLVPVLALLAAVVAMAVPPPFAIKRDGPRVMYGRAWSPLLWGRWQAAVNDGQAVARNVAHDLARQNEAVLITTHWNDEFYLRLRLFDLGYREVAAGPGCRAMSRYVLGKRQVWHVRLEPQYHLPPFDGPIAAALALVASGTCPAMRHVPNVWLTTWGLVPAAVAALGIGDDVFPSPPAISIALDSRSTAPPESPELLEPVLRSSVVSSDWVKILTTRAAEFLEARSVDISDCLDLYDHAFASRFPD